MLKCYSASTAGAPARSNSISCRVLCSVRGIVGSVQGSVGHAILGLWHNMWFSPIELKFSRWGTQPGCHFQSGRHGTAMRRHFWGQDRAARRDERKQWNTLPQSSPPSVVFRPQKTFVPTATKNAATFCDTIFILM